VVILTDSTFVGRTTINTGANNDQLTIGEPGAVTFQNGPVRLDGGSGIDTLTLDPGNDFPPDNPIKVGWEINITLP
jgi:hypothetical protein